MNFLIAVMLYLLAQFGTTPADNTIYTKVWNNAKTHAIEVNNVESYVQTSVNIPYSRFDPADQFDTCTVYVTIIMFNDGVPALQIERSCQAVEHDYLAVFEPTIFGMVRVEY